jgi:hypothetical protein
VRKAYVSACGLSVWKQVGRPTGFTEDLQRCGALLSNEMISSDGKLAWKTISNSQIETLKENDSEVAKHQGVIDAISNAIGGKSNESVDEFLSPDIAVLINEAWWNPKDWGKKKRMRDELDKYYQQQQQQQQKGSDWGTLVAVCCIILFILIVIGYAIGKH